MDDKLFEKLMESAVQADEIVRGDRRPSRTFEVTSDIVREIRNSTGLSQEKFARLFHISAIRNDPKHVVAALNSAA